MDQQTTQAMKNIRIKRTIRIGIGQQLTNGQENFGRGERRCPIVLEQIQANIPLLMIDIAVIDLGLELYSGWLEGIIGTECNLEMECAILVWCATYALYSASPLHQVELFLFSMLCFLLFLFLRIFGRRFFCIDVSFCRLFGRGAGRTVGRRVNSHLEVLFHETFIE